MNPVIPALLGALSTLPVLAPVAVPEEAPSTARPPGVRLGPRAVGDAPTTLGVTPEAPADLRGRGVWPVGTAPAVLHGFAPPSTTWGPGHRGVDLAASVGDPVHASVGGQITFAGSIAGRGVVVVDHGSSRTTYEPVTALVHVGDLVPRGVPIGVLQAGGHCLPGSCLHWGWIRKSDDTYLDPLDLVGRSGPVRLKPWEGLPAA